MSHTGTWKAFERRVAILFGGLRNPFSGAHPETGTAGDVRHPYMYIECKHRRKLGLWRLYEAVRSKAKLERKTPIICMHQHGEQGFLVVIHTDDLEVLGRDSATEGLPAFEGVEQ